ncbi:MAG TPA: VWA domain-containing protein [Acidobacteriota bacterium]|nr:VWA domain-containing protein [Acidobacteriota bacterium]HQM63260.1 VWA domain-containing protein [Acidobacteriota bacterium]
MRCNPCTWAMVYILSVNIGLGMAESRQPAVPDSRPEHVMKVTVDLVQVDVAVTDAKGRPVRDLKAEDFRVYENGSLRPVVYLRYVPEIAKRPGAPGAEFAGLAGIAGSGSDGWVNPGREPTPIVLVVDDLGLRFTSLANTRRVLRRFVDEQMRDGDRVALLCTGKNLGAFQPFTADKDLLRAAVGRLRWNPFSRTGLSGAVAAEELEMAPLLSVGGRYRSLQRERALYEYAYFREQVAVAGTFNTLEGVMQSLSAMPGRKVVVLLTDDIPMQPTGSRFLDYLSRFHRLIDQANTAGVRIYPVRPGGLETRSMTADTAGREPYYAQDSFEARERQLRAIERRVYASPGYEQPGLAVLANSTGGACFNANNDINKALDLVLQAQGGYYLIGYTPSEQAFQNDGERPRFNKLKLETVRPRLKLSYRRGYLGLDENARRPATRSRLEALTQALVRPLADDAFALALDVESDGAPPALRSLVRIDPRRLRFVRNEAGDYQATIDMLAVTLDKNGNLIDQSDRVFTVSSPPDQFEAARAKGLTLPYDVALPEAGGYQVRLAVRDAESGRTGTALRYVELK